MSNVFDYLRFAALSVALSACGFTDQQAQDKKSKPKDTPSGERGRVSLKQPSLANTNAAALGLHEVTVSEEGGWECGVDGGVYEPQPEPQPWYQTIELELASIDGSDYAAYVSADYEPGAPISIDDVLPGKYELAIRLNAYGQSYEGRSYVNIFAHRTTDAAVVLSPVDDATGGLNVEIIIDEDDWGDDGFDGSDGVCGDCGDDGQVEPEESSIDFCARAAQDIACAAVYAPTQCTLYAPGAVGINAKGANECEARLALDKKLCAKYGGPIANFVDSIDCDPIK